MEQQRGEDHQPSTSSSGMNLDESNSEDKITAEQTDKLLQFQDLTGLEDLEVCKALLQSKEWNLEAAAREQLQFPDEESQNILRRRRNSGTSRVERMVDVSNENNQNVFIGPTPSPWANWGLISSFFNLVWSVSSFPFNVISWVFRLIWPQNRRNFLTSDAVGDVSSFVETFEEQYGTLHPRFYRGSYSQVLNEAKQELKFLLVYLHSSEHEETDRFCNVTLANPDVVEFVDSNLLFWACSVTSSEGYRVSQAMRENGYPFLAMIVLRQGKMMIVGRIERLIEPAQFLQWAPQVIENNEAYIVTERADRSERQLSHTLRQEQDAAYRESLLMDQQKEAEKQEQEARRQAQIQEEKLEDERIANERARLERLKVELVSEIPPEPEASDPAAVKLVLKLPDGTRLERRFLKTHSLKVLYYFVFCNPDSPKDFDIVSNFPRRILPCKPCDGGKDPPSIEDSGLGKSEMLFVNDLDA